MYVIALENGFIRIEGGGGEYWLETNRPGEAALFIVSGEHCKINVEPFGSICIAQFEKSKEEYLKAGGNLEDMLNAFNRGGIIKLKPPYYPADLLKNRLLEALDLSSIPALLKDSRPLKAFYIPDGEKIIPVFEVESIEDLFFYDYLQLQAHKYKLRYCEDCGSIFPAHTNAVRCDKCRAAGMGAKKKIQAIKADEPRRLWYAITNRNKKQSRSSLPCDYSQTIDAAYNEHKTDIEFMRALDRMDKWFYTAFMVLNPRGKKELASSLKDGINAADPEKWLINWMKDKGIFEAVKQRLPNKSKSALINSNL